MRILLIKLTSLGDLIHALPALSDAKSARPELCFDWVIDEKFQEIATWHPAIRQIFTTNHRSWRDALFERHTFRSVRDLLKNLRKTTYDLIIDGQGNFKTALLSLCMRGQRAGYDKQSVRERIAHLAYETTYSVPKRAHAIERLRRLFALALDYPLPTSVPDFQIQKSLFLPLPFPLPSSYLVFVHNASWKTKLWPEAHWQELIARTAQLGLPIYLPWGNLEERARAERLAATQQAIVLPQLSLSQIGTLLCHASACVCMDTGLSHLTAALGTPSVTLYGSTDSGLIGASGVSQVHLRSTLPCSPCNQKKCRFAAHGLHPPCLAELTPARVFAKLQLLLERIKG